MIELPEHPDAEIEKHQHLEVDFDACIEKDNILNAEDLFGINSKAIDTEEEDSASLGDVETLMEFEEEVPDPGVDNAGAGLVPTLSAQETEATAAFFAQGDISAEQEQDVDIIEVDGPADVGGAIGTFDFYRELPLEVIAQRITVPRIKMKINNRWVKADDWATMTWNERADDVWIEGAMIGESTLRGGGLGCFARTNLPARSRIGYYLGPEIHHRTAKYLRQIKQHGHCYSIYKGPKGVIINGSPSPYCTLEMMMELGGIASLANTHPDLVQAANNCEFEHVIEAHQLHPGGRHCMTRVYLTTTRDVQAGEELFVWLSEDIAAHIHEIRMAWPDYRAFWLAQLEQD